MDYLSKNTTTCLKGFFALCILIHHISQAFITGNSLILGQLLGRSLGYFSVGMFFFFSGYGLMFSYINKKDAYIKNFPKTRILPFYIIILILSATYWLFFTALKIYSPPAKRLIQSLFFGGTVISKGWYLQAILVFYLLFYFSFRFIKSAKAAITVFSFFIVAYCVGCFYFGLAMYWYQAASAIILGALWCANKSGIDSFLAKSRARTAILSALGIAAVSALWYVGTLKSTGDVLRLWLRIISILIFVTSVILLVSLSADKPLLNNRLFALLGKYSFAIYVTQGMFLILFDSRVASIKSPVLYALCVCASTFALSVPVTVLFNKIYSAFRAKKKPSAVKGETV